jgi:hypothetical protein
MAQDDELFHRSRLVNCGYFMKIILGGTRYSSGFSVTVIHFPFPKIMSVPFSASLKTSPPGASTHSWFVDPHLVAFSETI